MREVAEITPIGSDPGLVAFVCTYRGAADSTIVQAKRWRSQCLEAKRQCSSTSKHGRLMGW